MSDEEIKRLAERICARLGIETVDVLRDWKGDPTLTESPELLKVRRTIEEWLESGGLDTLKEKM